MIHNNYDSRAIYRACDLYIQELHIIIKPTIVYYIDEIITIFSPSMGIRTISPKPRMKASLSNSWVGPDPICRSKCY